MPTRERMAHHALSWHGHPGADGGGRKRTPPRHAVCTRWTPLVMMYIPSMVVPLIGSIHSSAVPVTTSQHSPPTPQITPQGPGSAGVGRPSAGSGPMDARGRNSMGGV